jgi:GT2 family glycosyltransferase/tetratricopeptide (TPR) repeat protein/2-polyprenyl-3-methyl-5-hydroxy-6-metoxy-1,4-benzoquinol methylase
MPIRRVALIYDGQSRPETTGFYCRRALGPLVDFEHFEPGELARVPRTGFDLYLNIDDGLEYRLPPDLRPSAWWAIDTHLNFPWCLEKAREFDLVFAAQRDGAERLRREGIASAAWLPLACDPEIHRKHDVEKQYDFAFVGHIFPGPRAELIDLLRRRYRQHFVGNAYFEDMARIYSESRAVFNRSLKNDVNMRVFEALACGSLLLTNRINGNGQDELFRDGVHLAAYSDPDDLLDKLAFYLSREPLRERIAAQGRAKVLAKHTYRQRMERVLEEADALLGKRALRASPPHPASGHLLPAGEKAGVHAAADQTRPRGAALRSPSPQRGEGRGEGEPAARTGGTSTLENRPSVHDPFYFSHARPEVLDMVPVSARRVLDIGCGAGRLGEALKARQDAEVVGIELNDVAAECARGRLDEVHVGDAETIDPGFAAGSFDAIVCGDILEHLREPDRLLRRARQWLRPEGRLVASIPNVRHHSVIRSLLQGNWTYESAGLLDRDHVRFFTRREIEKLVFRAGFAIEEMKYVEGPEEGEGQTRREDEVRIGRLHVGGLSPAEASEFHAYQYLVRARPEPCPDFGLTSIVVVTHNQIDYTRLCLDGIRRLTDEPFELIVVDNGSTDGTVEYLGGLPGLRLVRNHTNRGFPAAANQGIAAATGSRILLLNNDTIVTTGWLRRLLLPLERDPKIGLVGPCSNCVSGPQQVEAGYDSLADLDGFAWDWGKAHHGEMVDIDRLVGFCLLIRREVVDAIGTLDEQFGIGCFEDDDYCLRAMEAGFRAVIARDAFVHHFGGRTFLGTGTDFASIMRANERRFRAKWTGDGVAAPDGSGRTGSGRSAGPFEVNVSPEGGLLLRRKQVRLSLCMIVRDSARTLPECIESIRPWVDEMVIVDTGSVDETPRIVELYGGRLFRFPWCDDFSAARNESLKHARGDWVFWMDSDDTIPPECGRGVRSIVNQAGDSGPLGYVVQVHCPGAGEDGDPLADVTVVDHVKLFRNRLDLRFDGRIHEQILPAIRQAGGDVAWTELYVVHSGSDQSPAAQERKRHRDLRILKLELAERPGHPFTLFNLGMTYVDGAQLAEGAEFLRRSIAVSGSEESHLRKAYALLVYAEMRLEHREEATRICRRARELFPDDTELRFREAVLLHDMGLLEEAVAAYHDVLDHREDRHFTSMDHGLAGFKARQNLALVYADLSRLDEAESQWRMVVSEAPTYRAGWRGLGETLVRRGSTKQAAAIARQMAGEPALRQEGFLLMSRITVASGSANEARNWLELALHENHDDLEAMRWACQFMFEHGTTDEAERALVRLLGRTPDDASAHHNLGTVLLREKRYEEAAESYRQALQCRPGNPATHLHLGYALKEQGLLSEAEAAWREVLRLSPGDQAASEELSRLERSARG